MTSMKREQIIATMRDRVADGIWTAVSTNTIRWSEELDTPAWAREEHPLIGASWPAPRYTRHLFITMFHTGSPVVGVAPAPWIGRRDHYATLGRVAELLADPRSAFRGAS